MRIEPLGDRVVIKRLDAEEKTSGGIVLPDSARETPLQGKVLSVGAGQLLSNGTRKKLQIAEGDRVLFTSYAGNELEINGDKVLIMSEAEVLAILG